MQTDVLGGDPAGRRSAHRPMHRPVRLLVAGLPAVAALAILIGLPHFAAPPIAAAAPAVLTATATATPIPPCGLAWRPVDSPSPGGSATLNGIAVVAPDDVWAVGAAADQALAEHWDGSRWTAAPVQDPGTSSAALAAVAASGPNDVWSVGTATESGTIYTLIEHWDGTAWSIVPSPNPGALQNLLMAVAVVGPDDVWAVGGIDNGVLIELLERYCLVRRAPAQSSALPRPA